VWDNPRLLNLAAGILVGIAVLAGSAVLLLKLQRSSLMPVREVHVVSALERTSRQAIEQALRGRIAGNFFAVEPSEVRAALQQLPWVRRVTVRRVWPDRLEVGIEEHVALARWGNDALVNIYGERFSAKTDQVLPLFLAPAGHETEVTLRYGSFKALLAPLGVVPERVVLSQRLAWQLRLSNGLHIMLGRDGDQAEARLRRFVGVYDATLKPLSRKHEYVDLRYPNGFALRVPELLPAVKG
jgi:cell division protein FtsQ